jgi:hypothetical protein
VNNLSNCPNCGQPAQPDDKFCRNCGIPFKDRAPEQEFYSETPPLTPTPPIPPPPPPPVMDSSSLPPPDDKHVPWEEREKYGFFAALWETWKESIVNPDKFFAKLPYSGGMGSPILYAVILGTISMVASAVYGMIFSTAWLGLISSLSHQPELFENAKWGTRWNLISIPLSPLIILVGLFIFSGIIHLIGKLLGWAKRDFEATLRAVAYSYAPYLFTLVPFCGSYISGIWALILVMIGYKHMQDTTTGKAVLTVLLPMILCCCLIIVLAFLFSAAIIAFITGKAASGNWDSF